MTLVYVLMIVLPGLLAWALLATFIPFFKQDAAWSRYNNAYNQWDSNGRKGKIPNSEDFGYKTIGNNKK